MPSVARTDDILQHLDEATRALVRVAAALAGGSEDTVRAALAAAAETTPHAWIEEVLLQTYLFAGFPRALNGMREWRRIAPHPVPDAHDVPPERWRPDGERTCALVYGGMYERLRSNVRTLHPSLDDWMVEEGYGKVLSRPGLDLPRRELCIVAACAATGQDRQLLSHLHGARNVGISGTVIGEALASLDVLVPGRLLDRATRLWSRIANDVH
jgi:4-carboxymuconolactone decarboxylase